MQEFLRESRFREAVDGFGLSCLTAALCEGWFIFLWGVTLPALLSGAALTVLALLIRQKTRDGRLRRREQRLRRRLGGEMALEEMLFEPPRAAHAEAARLLAGRSALTLLAEREDGALCRLREEKALVSFCQIPQTASVGPAEVLALQRAVRACGAARGILCAPCAVAPAAAAQADGPVPVTLIGRDTLIALLGRAHPATDGQLVALGKRKKRRGGPWLPLILRPDRAGRYLTYGALLLAMHLLTGRGYYAYPGIVCTALAAACRCRKRKEEIL